MRVTSAPASSSSFLTAQVYAAFFGKSTTTYSLQKESVWSCAALKWLIWFICRALQWSQGNRRINRGLQQGPRRDLLC